MVTLSSATLGKGSLCRVSGLEHSAEKQHLGTGKASLPSVVALTLGKEASFAECLLEHSAKKMTKGLAGRPFAECRLVEHSTKTPSLSPGVVTTTFLCRVPTGTRQSLCRVPDKKYSTKKLLLMYYLSSSLCRVSHSAKYLPCVF